MRDKQDAFALFHKIAASPEDARNALETLDKTVSCYSESAQPRLYLEYARGYFRWLMSGRPVLTVDKMRSIGNNAPDVQNGFRYEMGEPLLPSGARCENY